MIIESTLTLKIRIETEGEEDSLTRCDEIESVVGSKHKKLIEALKANLVKSFVGNEAGSIQVVDMSTHMSYWNEIRKEKKS